MSDLPVVCPGCRLVWERRPRVAAPGLSGPLASWCLTCAPSPVDIPYPKEKR